MTNREQVLNVYGAKKTVVKKDALGTAEADCIVYGKILEFL
jgi:hypothetical protein